MLQFDNYHISPINLKDVWPICDFIVANDDRLKTYFPKTLEQNLTPALSKVFVEKKVKQFDLKEEFLFTVKEHQKSNLVGLVYIKKLEWGKKQGEFAYCIGYEFEKKGITTKAIELLSIYAFTVLGLESLQIITHKNNIASVKVATNNTFLWKETLKDEFTPMGNDPLDMELYQLNKS